MSSERRVGAGREGEVGAGSDAPSGRVDDRSGEELLKAVLLRSWEGVDGDGARGLVVAPEDVVGSAEIVDGLPNRVVPDRDTTSLHTQRSSAIALNEMKKKERKAHLVAVLARVADGGDLRPRLDAHRVGDVRARRRRVKRAEVGRGADDRGVERSGGGSEGLGEGGGGWGGEVVVRL